MFTDLLSKGTRRDYETYLRRRMLPNMLGPRPCHQAGPSHINIRCGSGGPGTTGTNHLRRCEVLQAQVRPGLYRRLCEWRLLLLLRSRTVSCLMTGKLSLMP